MGASAELGAKINAYLSQWNSVPPTRSELEIAVNRILEWKSIHSKAVLWKKSPFMITATLDDGWGHGIQLIQRFAEAAGVKVFSLGLLQKVEAVVAACQMNMPDILGLTVLQFDTEDQLLTISRSKPTHTRIVAGGPVFSADPDFACRTGVDFVARSAADFWRFLLQFQPEK